MGESKMPAKIRVAKDADGFWTCREAVSGSPEYTRADLVEPLVEELDGLVQRFDTFDGQPFVNPADSPWSIARAAIAAYREAGQ